MSRGDRKNSGTLDDKMMLSMKNSKISHLITNSNMSIEDQITIINYISILESRDTILCALEAGGVNNWEWYGESIKNFLEKRRKNFNER